MQADRAQELVQRWAIPVQALAFWPAIYWFGYRTYHGGMEPWSLAALIAAGWFLWKAKGGKPLTPCWPLVALAALLYGLFGQHIPGEFGHSGTPLASFLGTLTIAEGGLWGPLIGISVGVVSIFVIFGAVLNAGEAGQGFMNLAAAAAGRLHRESWGHPFPCD